MENLVNKSKEKNNGIFERVLNQTNGFCYLRDEWGMNRIRKQQDCKDKQTNKQKSTGALK